MKNLIEELKALRESDEREFKYQLRNLLKKTQIAGSEAFVGIVAEFKREILYDSFFFIDLLNEAIFYFFLEEGEECFEWIMSLIHVAAPVGDRDTLDVLKQILKKHPRHSSHYPSLMNYYGEIEHKISFLEQKISKLKLYSPKPMIVEWYE